MASPEGTAPPGGPTVAAEDLSAISGTPGVLEHDDDPQTSASSPAVATEVTGPHDATLDKAKDESKDPSSHPHLSQIEQEGSGPDTNNLNPGPTARDAREPSFEDKTPYRNTRDSYPLSRIQEDSAAYFSSAELYDVYVQKLQKLRELGDPANTLSEQGKPKVLVRSLVDYLSSYEERIKSIEDKLGIELKHETPAKNNIGPDVAGIKFYDVDDPVHAAIDAPDETEDEWNVSGAFNSTVDTNHRIRALFKWKNKPNSDVQPPPDPKSVEVLELRIKSKSVADFFQKELDNDISKDGMIHLAKPFRCLIKNIDLIRQHINRGGKQLHSLSRTTSLSGTAGEKVVDAFSGPGTNASTTIETTELGSDSLGSEVALLQLKELLDFVDSYLQVDVALFQEYKNGTRPSITFSNLWMLFDSTDTIFCPLKQGENKIYSEEDDDEDEWWRTMEFETPQVYRVLATLGGNIRRPPRTKQKKSSRTLGQEINESSSQHIRERWASLYVDCYFIEFDGVRFMAVADAFGFKPFEGEVLVTSLEAFPLRYLRSSSVGDKESLIQRGAHYADLTSVRHVSHKGLTLGERKQEVDSPVIVDFKSAYQHEPDWQPELASEHIVSWNYVQSSILEIPKRTCTHADCHKISCLQDVALILQKAAVSKGMRDINILLDDYKVENKEQIEKFKEDMKSRDLLHLLPGAAYAFALRNRKWVKIDLKNLRTVKQEDNWDDLILPPGHKDMVQAMVENFTSTGSAAGGIGSRDDYDMDLVPGKGLRTPIKNLIRSRPLTSVASGKGCIILLHGEPGVGKTSTAECVAAYTKRPLYPITCGDIGITPTEVEEALDSHFSRAHKWGCVLLLDEADVFLAKRNRNGDDIKRNGLVSVFLRTLEYYSGILFLTTNRVGSFDDAFRSRIHVQLYYPKLTAKQAVKIWRTNITRLQRHNEDRKNKNMPEVAIDEKKIVHFAKKNFEALHWNGRQIRNAFQTAVALAEFESRKAGGKSPEVAKKHFQRVAAATSEFDEYLKQVNQGADEEKIAGRDLNRVAFTPVSGKFKSVSMEDSSSSDSDSSKSSDQEASEDDSSSSDSDAKGVRSREKKKRRKEGEKKSKKSKKAKDS
ncbi:hypothetical protein Daus18300_006179 [Diaporthe australafricana]|uniref:AAA+ ATPase domain-containing protein n=1 Tax=Diaporthe australafricana TaxID=127596 RepID=A0ABR3WX55_9PEZI